MLVEVFSYGRSRVFKIPVSFPFEVSVLFVPRPWSRLWDPLGLTVDPEVLDYTRSSETTFPTVPRPTARLQIRDRTREMCVIEYLRRIGKCSVHHGKGKMPPVLRVSPLRPTEPSVSIVFRPDSEFGVTSLCCQSTEGLGPTFRDGKHTRTLRNPYNELERLKVKGAHILILGGTEKEDSRNIRISYSEHTSTQSTQSVWN